MKISKKSIGTIVLLFVMMISLVGVSINVTSCDVMCQVANGVTDITTSIFGFRFLADIDFCQVAQVFNFGNNVESSGITVDGDQYDGVYSFFSDDHVTRSGGKPELHPNYIAAWNTEDTANATPNFITRVGKTKVVHDGEVKSADISERIYCDPETGEEHLVYESGDVVCGFVLEAGVDIKESSHPIARDGNHPTKTKIQSESSSSGTVRMKLSKKALKAIVDRRKNPNSRSIGDGINYEVVNREEYLKHRSPYFAENK